jgi:hypothetical protein
MMFYGDEFRTINGIIRDIQDSIVDIEFEASYSGEKIMHVPKNIIRPAKGSEINLQKNMIQQFKLPLWYLKRNRIVPLVEKDMDD